MGADPFGMVELKETNPRLLWYNIPRQKPTAQPLCRQMIHLELSPTLYITCLATYAQPQYFGLISTDFDLDADLGNDPSALRL